MNSSACGLLEPPASYDVDLLLPVESPQTPAGSKPTKVGGLGGAPAGAVGLLPLPSQSWDKCSDQLSPLLISPVTLVTGRRDMDWIEAGFMVSALTGTILLIASILWLAVL